MSSIPEIILDNAEILYKGRILEKDKLDQIRKEMEAIIRQDTKKPKNSQKASKS